MIEVDKLSIWQQNVNKSPTCQHDLLSSDKLIKENIDVLAIQEPALNFNNFTVASRDWTPVYPTTHGSNPRSTRSMLMIRAQISTDSWNQLDFDSGDVTAIQLNGSWGKLKPAPGGLDPDRGKSWEPAPYCSM